GGGSCGRLWLLYYHTPHRAAPVAPHPRGPGGVLLPGQLELVRVADDDHLEPGPARGPARHPDVPAAVRSGLELHPGRLDGGGAAHPGDLLRLPEADRRLDQDLRTEVSPGVRPPEPPLRA